MRPLTRALLLTSAFIAPREALAVSERVVDMTAASALGGTELLYCVQGGADRKCTPAQIATYITGTFGSNVATAAAQALNNASPAGLLSYGGPAAGLSFTQTGTGMPARTVAKEFQDRGLVATEMAGVDPTAATSSVAGFKNLCGVMNARGGGTIRIPAGTYMIDATIDCSAAGYYQDKGQSWTIEYEAGAKFVATSALSTSVWRVWCGNSGTATPPAQSQTCRLTFINPDINMASATCAYTCKYTTGGTTAIEAQDQLNVVILNPKLVGAASFINDNANNGITGVRIGSLQVFGGFISGMANGGLYIDGDLKINNPPDYGVLVTGTMFTHNITGIECKDQVSCTIQGCFFDHNHIGIGSFTAGAGDSEPSARVMNVIGNTILHSQQNALYFNESTKGVITGNIMIDIGYDETKTLTNAGTEFVWFNGVSGMTYNGNTVAMRDWINSGFIGIVTVNATFNSVLFTAGGITGTGNIMKGITYGLYETSGVAASQLEMTVNGVATPCTITNAGTRCILTNTYTYSTLPGCGSAQSGMSVGINDNNQAAWCGVASGSGTKKTRATCNGTNWLACGG